MKKIISISLVLILFLILIPDVTRGQEEKSLSLEECIVLALENNLYVAVESINPDLAELSLTRAKEFFMPRFDLTYGAQRSENPPYWWLEGEDTITTDRSDYSASFVQQIPSGGNFSLSLTSYGTDTNQAFQLINPRFGSTIRLDFIQPLLKNFGFKVSRKQIIIAQNNLNISGHQFQSALIETIYLVQEAYWNLVYSIENYKVKQQSLQLARDLLEKNKKMVAVGKLAPIEVLNAETVVASREADILQAEALIRSNEDLLKTIINLSTEAGISPAKIVPSDKPEFKKREISLDEALNRATNNRPDLIMARIGIKTTELNVSVAKNQMLPELNLHASYWSPGISGDRILYQDNNPFTGIIVGKEKGSASDSLRDAFKILYNNWSVGLTLSIPLSNLLTRAEYAQARVELEKSLLEFKDLEQRVFLEVRNAVRDIETNSKRVQAYRLARELAEKRLEAEEKKLGVGLTTNYFVLQYQEGLANAQSMEIKAIVDFNLSWGKLDRTMGTTLKNRNIKIQ